MKNRFIVQILVIGFGYLAKFYYVALHFNVLRKNFPYSESALPVNDCQLIGMPDAFYGFDVILAYLQLSTPDCDK